MKILSIESLGAGLSDEALGELAEADVIIGLDIATQREFTVFGTPSLESTTSFKKPSAMRIVQVALHCETGELEELATLVRRIKGLSGPVRHPK